MLPVSFMRLLYGLFCSVPSLSLKTVRVSDPTRTLIKLLSEPVTT